MKTLSKSNILDNRRKDLDFLRGLGLFLVIIEHAFPSLIPGGFIGVDFFFVISGYLITKKTFALIEKNQFSVWDYFQYRFKRIIPPALVSLIFTFHFFVYFCNPLELRLIIEQIYSSLLFFNNIYSYLVTQYFNNGYLAKPYIHFWSLSIEEQYYFLWPFLALFINKAKKYRNLSLLIIVMSSFLYSLYLSSYDQNGAYLLLPSRLWQILIGGVIALSKLDKLASLKKSNTLAFTGLSLITYSALFIDKQHYPGLYALFPTLGTISFILATNSSLSKFISKGVFVFLGRISYSMYLLHMPFLSVLFYSYHITTPYKLLFIFLAFIFSLLLFYFVENPTQKLKDKVKIKRVNLVSIAGILSSLIYLNLYNYDFIFTEHKQRQMQVAKLFFNDGLDGRFRFTTQYCNSDTKAENVIIGDSHAAHYLGATRELENFDIGVFQHGVIPSISLEYQFKSFNTELYQQCLPKLIENQHIKRIIISSRIPLFLSHQMNKHENYEKFEGNFKLSEQSKLSNQLAVEKTLRDLIKAIKKGNKEIIFLSPTPITNTPPRELRKCLMDDPKSNDCNLEVDFIETLKENYEANILLNKFQKNFADIQVFSVLDALCANKKPCSLYRDRKTLYRDDDHLSNYGALLVLRELSKKIHSPTTTQQ
tara:strand:+ start:137717 stop:139666 length:1950 start_codon:yes stop_codon:yes gene_type:complete